MTFGTHPLDRKVHLKFSVIKSHSPYNVIIGRSGLCQLGAMVSTVHSMMKFPTPRGVATVSSERKEMLECLNIDRELETEQVEREKKERRVEINDAYPDQCVIIGGSLQPRYQEQLQEILKKNVDVFAGPRTT